MRPFLAIETATDRGSVAVGDRRAAAAEIVVGGRRHAAALVPAVHEVLRLAGLRYGDLMGVVVADGPGSFTGLRIGFATALGILREHPNLELRTASSMLGAAWNAASFVSGAIAGLYDALRGEVFGAVYAIPGDARGAARDGTVDDGEEETAPTTRESGDHRSEARAVVIETIVEPCLVTVSELRRRCRVRPVVAVGDGALAYAEEVHEWTGRAAVGPPAGGPSAGALLGLLGVAGGTRRVDDPTSFEPAYGRLAEAQVRWEREHGRPLPHPDG